MYLCIIIFYILPLFRERCAYVLKLDLSKRNRKTKAKGQMKETTPSLLLFSDQCAGVDKSKEVMWVVIDISFQIVAIAPVLVVV